MTRLLLARALLDAGAGHSARNVLGTERGAHANRIRLASYDVQLRPGIYCPVTLPDGSAAVLPLQPVPGHPRATDRVFREACVTAYELARTILQDPTLPMLRFELEEDLALFGPSIGLPAALAFVSCFAPGRAPARAVVATGELLPDGRVNPVGQLDAKHAIAEAEHASLFLSPTSVSTFAEAARAVFGERPLRLDVIHSPIDAMLQRARSLSAPEDSITLLESVDRNALAGGDRARVLFDLGTFQRNRGNSRLAWELHSEAKVLLAAERHVVGEEAAERYDLECWVTELDRFRLDATVSALRERLGRPFLKLRNELRCRGMLAQGLAMLGHFAEAVTVRSANLALHDRSASLAKVRPATLCHLTLDSALAHDGSGFDRHATALASATRPGDEQQWRYNATAIVRGLVALGRDDEAIRWSRDESSLFGCRAPATLLLARTAPRITAPEMSALRALVRASRRTGGDLAFGERAVEAAGEPPDLYGWMAGLLRLEVGLDARAFLERTHPEATAFHAGLLSDDRHERDKELDRVWY